MGGLFGLGVGFRGLVIGGLVWGVWGAHFLQARLHRSKARKAAAPT